MRKTDFNLYLFLAVALLLLTVAWAMAQSEGSSPDNLQRPSNGTSPFQSKFDTNNDGKVTKEEWQSGWNIIFDAADKNADQYLAQAEVESMEEKIGSSGIKLAEKLEEKFQAMDGDGDGKVSQSEWKGPEQMFSKLDQDQDGSITSKELEDRSLERKPGNRLQQMDADGDSEISQNEWKGPDFAFNRIDSNQDGKLSQEELAAGSNPVGGGKHKAVDLQASFKLIDTDEDGKISKPEIRAWSENEFLRRDTNQDDMLTEVDREGMRKGPFGKSFKKSLRI